MKSLEARALRLAHTQPTTRKHLLPLLRLADDTRLTRDEAKEFAETLLSDMLKIPDPLLVKTASAGVPESVSLKKEIKQQPNKAKAVILETIQKNPSAWRAIKNFFRGQPNTPLDKTALSSLLKKVFGGLALALVVGAGAYGAHSLRGLFSAPIEPPDDFTRAMTNQLSRQRVENALGAMGPDGTILI